MSNYATKSDSKNKASVDTKLSAKKNNIADLQSEVDRLDVDKFGKTPNILTSLKSKIDKLNVDKLRLVDLK